MRVVRNNGKLSKTHMPFMFTMAEIIQNGKFNLQSDKRSKYKVTPLSYLDSIHSRISL